MSSDSLGSDPATARDRGRRAVPPAGLRGNRDQGDPHRRGRPVRIALPLLPWRQGRARARRDRRGWRGLRRARSTCTSTMRPIRSLPQSSSSTTRPSCSSRPASPTPAHRDDRWRDRRHPRADARRRRRGVRVLDHALTAHLVSHGATPPRRRRRHRAVLPHRRRIPALPHDPLGRAGADRRAPRGNDREPSNSTSPGPQRGTERDPAPRAAVRHPTRLPTPVLRRCHCLRSCRRSCPNSCSGVDCPPGLRVPDRPVVTSITDLRKVRRSTDSAPV